MVFSLNIFHILHLYGHLEIIAPVYLAFWSHCIYKVSRIRFKWTTVWRRWHTLLFWEVKHTYKCTVNLLVSSFNRACSSQGAPWVWMSHRPVFIHKTNPVSTGDIYIIQWQSCTREVSREAEKDNRMWSVASDREKASGTGETAKKEEKASLLGRGGLHGWVCKISKYKLCLG